MANRDKICLYLPMKSNYVFIPAVSTDPHVMIFTDSVTTKVLDRKLVFNDAFFSAFSQDVPDFPGKLSFA